MIQTLKSQPFIMHLTQQLTRDQIKDVANWITQSGELRMISGLSCPRLSEDELEQWFQSALQAVVVVTDRKVIGIATLSRSEVDLPTASIEICHCIVHPYFRRVYNGSTLVTVLSAYAKRLGYKTVVGRVLRSNTVGFALLKSLHWNVSQKPYNNDESVIWLEKNFK